jgi:hypothetical protein
MQASMMSANLEEIGLTNQKFSNQQKSHKAASRRTERAAPIISDFSSNLVWDPEN